MVANESEKIFEVSGSGLISDVAESWSYLISGGMIMLHALSVPKTWKHKQ